MNLLNKNKLGLKLSENNFFASAKEKLIKRNNKRKINGVMSDEFMNNSILLHPELFDFKCQKTIRISESIFILSQSINIESIYKNIDSIDLKFTDISIIMPSDKIGVIYIKKIGGDIFFIWVKNIQTDHNLIEYEINIYNFFTKEFSCNKTEKSEIVLQILTYLFYGEIQEKRLVPNQRISRDSFLYIKNETKKDIWFADSLWKTKISLVGDFKVKGHFRLQPVGEERKGRKLIFIDEFIKHGYNRNATVENFNKCTIV